MLNPAHPSVSQFNYVLAGVKLENGYLLLDATDASRAAKLLPFRTLNGQGRWIDKNGGYWVNLNTGGSFKQITMLEATVDEEGNFNGKLTRKQKDYAALMMRRELSSMDGEEAFVKELEENYEGLNVNSHTLENLTDISKDIKEIYEVSIEEQSNVSGDFIYFSPLLCFAETENPFKLEDRKYPIDYGFKVSDTYSMRFKVPDGYLIEELPEKAVVNLPDNAGKFTFHVANTGNEIMINSKFDIKKALFTHENYASLKEFYNLMIDKHAEQVVLKKKT